MISKAWMLTTKASRSLRALGHVAADLPHQPKTAAPFGESAVLVRLRESESCSIIDLRVMSANPVFALFERSVRRFGSARKTCFPMSPQDLGHPLIATNIANNCVFVKLTKAALASAGQLPLQTIFLSGAESIS